jgi:transaldolase
MERATGTTRKEMAFASKLVQLRAMTTIVADTSDIKAVAGFKPTDCTTNPTIVLKKVSAQKNSATLSSKPSPGDAERPETRAPSRRRLQTGLLYPWGSSS